MIKSTKLISIPVFGLVIPKSAKQEIRVGRVLFVDAKKIRRIWKRLGFNVPISEYEKKFGRNLFANSQTYAFLKANMDSRNDSSGEFKVFQEAFWLLASSFTSFTSRENAAMSLGMQSVSKSIRDISVFDARKNNLSIQHVLNRPYVPNICDSFWAVNADSGHFRNLQRIIRGDRKIVDSKWKAAIVRAATLLGQSFLAKHVAEAFTYDMIALETLLCKRDDRFPNALIDRIQALFGWINSETPASWKEKIERMYDLRCGYVHDGSRGDINGMDLLFADNLVSNLLANICRNTRHIQRKDDIIKLAQQLEARRILGLAPRRKGKLTFQTRNLLPNEKKQILDTSRWEW